MRNRILTPHEVKILEAYLKKDVRLNGFAVFVHRIKRQLPSLREEVVLMERILVKLDRKS